MKVNLEELSKFRARHKIIITTQFLKTYLKIISQVRLRWLTNPILVIKRPTLSNETSEYQSIIKIKLNIFDNWNQRLLILKKLIKSYWSRILHKIKAVEMCIYFIKTLLSTITKERLKNIKTSFQRWIKKWWVKLA